MPDRSVVASSSVMWRLAFAGSAILSVVVLFAPSDGGASGIFPGADKVGHATLFALVAVTGALAGLPVRETTAALLGYAVGSEVAQALLLPRRAGDPRDVVADLTGVAIGLLVVRALARRSSGALPAAAATHERPLPEGNGLPS